MYRSQTTLSLYLRPECQAVKINPQKIPGPWTSGYSLDRHVESSVPTGGLTPGGYTEFDTKRTELGELVYRLKYGGKKENISEIAEAVLEFVRGGWGDSFDAVVPAPPSVTRSAQPLIEIARAVAEGLRLPLKADAVAKVKTTTQMKNVPISGRPDLLRDAIQKGASAVADQRVLLLDDVIESGATLRRVAEVLLESGAKSVHALVVTRTK